MKKFVDKFLCPQVFKLYCSIIEISALANVGVVEVTPKQWWWSIWKVPTVTCI